MLNSRSFITPIFYVRKFIRFQRLRNCDYFQFAKREVRHRLNFFNSRQKFTVMNIEFIADIS